MKEFLLQLKEYWFIIVPLFTLVSTYIIGTYKRIKKMEAYQEHCSLRADEFNGLLDLNKLQSDMLLSISRAQLKEMMCAEIAQGYTTLHTYETIAKMYESYTAMGGNSFIHDMHERYKLLKIESE